MHAICVKLSLTQRKSLVWLLARVNKFNMLWNNYALNAATTEETVTFLLVSVFLVRTTNDFSFVAVGIIVVVFLDFFCFFFLDALFKYFHIKVRKYSHNSLFRISLFMLHFFTAVPQIKQ